ncbi:MAG: carboxypeptidase-like regulatory domain-containing protein [Bacteroidia bacterium]
MKLFVRLGLCMLGLLLTVTTQGQNAQIRGVVIDVRGEPLGGAAVYVPAANAGAYANDEGIFAVSKLEEGKTYEVISYFVGYDTTRMTVAIPRGSKAVTVKFVLKERAVFTDEVEILGEQVGKIEKKRVTIGNTKISVSDIKLIPSIGAPDLMQYLQVLPGVVSTGDQGGQLYIRGGTPIQNMTLFDGMILYSPFHSIGLFSVFDPEIIRSADVFSAAFPAQYGGRVSSVIDIKTRNGSFNKFSATANANPFSASLLLEGPIGKSKREGGGISYILSARNNYIDQTGSALYPYINDGEGLPYNFRDVYGKLTASDGINFVNLFGFRHEDNVLLGFPANISWLASGGGANFMTLPQGAAAVIRGNFAFSNYRTNLRSESEDFPRESGVSGFNGGLDVSYIVNSIDEVKAGFTFLGFQTDYTFTNSFGFITDVAANNTEAAFFVNYKKVIRAPESNWADNKEPWDLMVIEPSLRLHYFNDQAHVAFEPRLRWKLNLPKVSFSFATGLYTQNLLSAQSDRDVVNLFQGFLSAPDELANRNKNHNLQTAFHLLAGMELELAPKLSTTIEFWRKDFTQLTNINRDKVFPEDPNFITEIGEAYGADISLKYQTKKFYAYGTYGIAKVTRDDGIRTYPTVFDRRHNVNLVTALRLKPFLPIGEGPARVAPKFKENAWEFSARWSLGSGFPFTQTQGFFEKLDFRDDGAQTDIATQNGNLGIILADELNGGRLPYYHRLDLSAKRRWLVKNKFLIEASFNLVNTYDRDNIFYFDRVRFAPVYQLPVLPSLGVTVKY